MKLLKAVLLISAFFAVVLRLLAYENAEFLGESAAVYNIIAVVSAAVCLVTAIIWAVIIKKQEKEKKNDENEE